MSTPVTHPRPLPPGWRWVKLGEVCEHPTETRDPRRTPDAEFRYVDISSVDNQAKRIVAAGVLKGADAPSRARQVIRGGDVIVATTRPNLNAVAVVPPELDGEVCSTGFCVLRPTGEVLTEWLFAGVRTPEFVKGLSDIVRGALYPGVTDRQVFSQALPLPPLPEQRRIAGMLKEQMQEVEKGRAATEAQLAAARALPAAYLREVFESPEAKQWPRRPLGGLVDNFDGRRVPVKREERRKGPYPYYGASGVIDHVDGYLFDGEYLLIGEDGANLLLRSTPVAYRAAGRFWVNNHAHVVRPKGDTEMDWLLNLIAVTDLTPYVTGAAQPKMTQDAMNSIPVPVPSIERQRELLAAFACEEGAASTASVSIDAQMSALDRLPAALLRRAFRGEV